jgi:hypothetical protein
MLVDVATIKAVDFIESKDFIELYERALPGDRIMVRANEVTYVFTKNNENTVLLTGTLTTEELYMWMAGLSNITVMSYLNISIVDGPFYQYHKKTGERVMLNAMFNRMGIIRDRFNRKG